MATKIVKKTAWNWLNCWPRILLQAQSKVKPFPYQFLEAMFSGITKFACAFSCARFIPRCLQIGVAYFSGMPAEEAAFISP
jgi:hypothetical protein